MSFFKKVLGKAAGDVDAPDAVEPHPPAPIEQQLGAVLVGALPCSDSGCHETTAVPCAYVDRRGRKCGTAFCSRHHANIGGKAYCRRHAGVVRALLQSADVDQGPDVDSRAPSLAEWVANDIDGDVRRLLDAVRGSRPDLVLTADPLSVILLGTPRSRCWQRMWKLSDTTGILIKVAVFVDEMHDDEVVVRVDSEVLGRVVPPWIADRTQGRPGGAESQLDEPARRAAFRREFLDAIQEAVDARREMLQSGG
jgi:hypothetical protein